MSSSGRSFQLLIVSMVVVVIAVGVSFYLVLSEQKRLYDAQVERQLRSQAAMIRAALPASLDHERIESVAVLLQPLRDIDTVAAVVDLQGRVVADNGWLESGDLPLLLKPETREALAAGWGTAVRPRGPAGQANRTLALRVDGRGGAMGVVWLAQPLWTIAGKGRSITTMVAGFAGIALVAVGILAWLMLRLRRRLLRRLVATARELSAGDAVAYPAVGESDEFALLSASLNETKKRLQAQMDTIERQRATLESLVAQLNEGVVVTHANGRIMLMNPAAVRFLDVHCEGKRGPVGQPMERWIPQHALQKLLRRQHFVSARGSAPVTATEAGGDADGTDENEAMLQVENSSGVVHLLARASDIVLPGDGKGTPESVGRALVLTDVTDLERTIEMKTDFVANASHELRTPVSTIRATVETLLGMDLEHEARTAEHFIEIIDRQSVRLEAMVSDLLDLSRVESPTARFEPQPFNVSAFFRDVHGRFEESLEAAELRWEAEATGEPGPIVASPQLLRLVVDNLVDNAIKFTPPGGLVRLTCHRGRQGAVLTVSDTGCGIPEEDQERVFERFYQVERARAGGVERGTGLGLSIVRHAVAAMKGSVRLESGHGKGTRITVELPDGRPVAGSV